MVRNLVSESATASFREESSANLCASFAIILFLPESSRFGSQLIAFIGVAGPCLPLTDKLSLKRLLGAMNRLIVERSAAIVFSYVQSRPSDM